MMTPTLELPKGALCCHFSLEMLDSTLNTSVTDLHLKRAALHWFARISHGERHMAEEARDRKHKRGFSTMNRKEEQAFERPTGIKAPHGARIFEISWANGETHRIPHEILRGFCPCAGCQGHSGTVTFQPGSNLELLEIKPVGNYALSLKWADSHETGIYSFHFLKSLGTLHLELGTPGLIARGTLPRASIVQTGNAK
jgi:DUF971 family protein